VEAGTYRALAKAGTGARRRASWSVETKRDSVRSRWSTPERGPRWHPREPGQERAPDMLLLAIGSPSHRAGDRSRPPCRLQTGSANPM